MGGWDKIEIPKAKFKDLPEDAQRLALLVIRDFIKHYRVNTGFPGRALGIEKAEEVTIELFNEGLLKFWGDDEGMGVLIYSTEVGDYVKA